MYVWGQSMGYESRSSAQERLVYASLGITNISTTLRQLSSMCIHEDVRLTQPQVQLILSYLEEVDHNIRRHVIMTK